MHDLLPDMRIFQSVEQGFKPLQQVSRIKDLAGLLDAQVRQIASVHILHRNRGSVLIVLKVVNTNDVRMG